MPINEQKQSTEQQAAEDESKSDEKKLTVLNAAVTAKIEALKNAGNSHFSSKSYAVSVQVYSSAIAMLRQALGMDEGASFDAALARTLAPAVRRLASVLLANRANSLIQTGAMYKALEDAEQAVAVDPTYPKGYFRRGTALIALRRCEEAMNDFHKAAFLCPRDPTAMQKVHECEELVKQQARLRQSEREEAEGRQAHIKQLAATLSQPNSSTNHGPPAPSTSSTDGSPVLSPVPTEAELSAMLDGFKRGVRPHAHHVAQMLFQLLGILRMLPNVVEVALEPGERVTVVGDLHGQFFDLLKIFEINGLPSATNAYVFNGDFVDRGAWGVEVAVTLCTLKCMYPGHVHLARGNHETVVMNRAHGFSSEVEDKYDAAIGSLFEEVFCALPLAHVLAGRVFVVHGGLSARSAHDITSVADMQRIDRFCQPREGTPMSDLLWSDPQPLDGVAMSRREVGCLFGPDVTRGFLAQNGLAMVVRSHECVHTGYEIAHGGALVTVFSAPNYCDQLRNEAAIARFTAPDMVPEYITFTAAPHPNPPRRHSFFNFFNFL